MSRTLLAVATAPLSPVDNGFALRAASLLRELGRTWEVVLVAPPPEGGRGEAFPEAWEFLPVHLGGRWRTHPAQFDTRPLRTAVEGVLSRRAPAAALLWSGAEFLAMQPGFPPAVGDRIDSLGLLFWREALAGGGTLRRVRAVRDAVAHAAYERRLVRALPATVVVGADDATALRRISGRDSVHVVPNGVELPSVEAEEGEAALPTVVFSGVMDYRPNVEAAVFFAEHVWPRVRQEIPAARFLIAGRDPLPEVTALGEHPGVEVLGRVAEMAPVLRSAWVAVAPMQSGAGIKNKVLEAWAAARPVVMTRLAANGLRLDGDAEGLVADDPRDQAARVAGLLRDPAERHRLGGAAYALAAREHSWASAAEEISELLDRARRAAGSTTS